MDYTFGQVLFHEDGSGANIRVAAIWPEQRVIMVETFTPTGRWIENKMFTVDQLRKSGFSKNTW